MVVAVYQYNIKNPNQVKSNFAILSSMGSSPDVKRDRMYNNKKDSRIFESVTYFRQASEISRSNFILELTYE